MSKTRTDFAGLLQVLTAHHVDFIIVGGVSAALQGVPINTLDLDIVQERSSENISKLMDVLRELDAHYRLQPELRLRPDASHLYSEEIHVGEFPVRVLSLQMLIDIKEAIGRDKDRAVLAILKRTLKEKGG